MRPLRRRRRARPPIGPADAKEGDAEAKPSPGILSTSIMTDGTLAPALWIPGGGSVSPTSHATVDEGLHYVHMKGQEIFQARG